MLVGHTVQDSGRATSRCGGQLLLLDVGMSAEILGSSAAAWTCNAGSPDASAAGDEGNPAPSVSPAAGSEADAALKESRDGGSGARVEHQHQRHGHQSQHHRATHRRADGGGCSTGLRYAGGVEQALPCAKVLA